VGGTIFIQLAIRLELLTLREWLMIPFGKKILRFMGGK
jgi:PST family polysaccharide transporter